MLDSWPQDKLVAVALLIAGMTPDSKASLAQSATDSSSFSSLFRRLLTRVLTG